jgi:hypothetical protein
MTTKAKAKKPAPKTKRAAKFPADAKIKLLVDANPKRKGSACFKRFAKYKTGMSVAQALEKGLTRPDLIWDVDRGFISIG